MVLILQLISFVALLLALLASAFAFWRKLHHEHSDDIESIIDRGLIAVVIGILIARYFFVIFNFKNLAFSLPNFFLFPVSGFYIPVGIIVALVCFYKLVGSWKDPVELTDFFSIGAAFFLGAMTVGNLLRDSLHLNSVVSLNSDLTPMVDIKSIVIYILLAVFYFALSVFLLYLEQNYRTYLWYRAKRRSAQTGFLIGTFLICYGFAGFISGWILTPQLRLFGVRFDPFISLLVMLGGFVVLYRRSGRTFLDR